MHPNAFQCREASNSSRLYPSRRHGNTSGRSLKFKKIPALLWRHGVGRHLALVRMLGQHRPNAKIFDKEIVCIHFAFVQTTGQYCPDAVLDMTITCRQRATVWTLGQHYPDATLIWKRLKHFLESRLHRRLSEHSMLPSWRSIEKLETDSF